MTVIPNTDNISEKPISMKLLLYGHGPVAHCLYELMYKCSVKQL